MDYQTRAPPVVFPYAKDRFRIAKIIGLDYINVHPAEEPVL